MSSLHGSNSEFTYDNLSEIRLDPFWTSLASIITVAFLIVVTLATSGQPSVQADVPGTDTTFAASVLTDADEGVAAP
jgi:hypothetical protein